MASSMPFYDVRLTENDVPGAKLDMNSISSYSLRNPAAVVRV